MTDNTIPELDLRVDITNPSAGIKQLIHFIRPAWLWDNVIYERLQHGFGNYIWNVHVADDEDDALLVRVYDPAKTYIPWDIKFQFVRLLHEKKIIAPVYCRFCNGYSYKFIHGTIMTPHQLVKSRIYRQVISKFHQFHQIDTSKMNLPEPYIPWRKTMRTFISVFNSSLTEHLDTMDRFTSNFPSRQMLVEELTWATQHVYLPLESEFPMVLCHNDAHVFNIIIGKDESKLDFIDFDLAGITPEVFDIAVHLERDPQLANQEAGIDLVSDEAFKREWLKCYLETHPQYCDKEITPALLQKWLDGLNRSFYLSSSAILLFALLQVVAQKPEKKEHFWKTALALHKVQRQSKALFLSEPVRGCQPWSDQS